MDWTSSTTQVQLYKVSIIDTSLHKHAYGQFHGERRSVTLESTPSQAQNWWQRWDWNFNINHSHNLWGRCEGNIDVTLWQFRFLVLELPLYFTGNTWRNAHISSIRKLHMKWSKKVNVRCFAFKHCTCRLPNWNKKHASCLQY